MLGPGHWGDVIITEAPDYLKGDVKMLEIHTLVECSAPDCKLGVRNEYAVLGMCVTCAEGEIERLRGIERALMMGVPVDDVVKDLREIAAMEAKAGNHNTAHWFNAIADALEKEAK